MTDKTNKRGKRVKTHKDKVAKKVVKKPAKRKGK